MITNILFFVLGVFLVSMEGAAYADAAMDAALQPFRAKIEEEFQAPVSIAPPVGRAIRGNKNAPVLIQVFSDFQCPFCKDGFEITEQLRKIYGNKVAILYRHFPMERHPQALPSALRFEAIAKVNAAKAYEFHDALFREPEKLNSRGEAWLDELTKNLGLSVKKMSDSSKKPWASQHIEQDKADFSALKLAGTPSFVVGGIRIGGALPVEVFREVVDRLIAQRARSARIRG